MVLAWVIHSLVKMEIFARHSDSLEVAAIGPHRKVVARLQLTSYYIQNVILLQNQKAVCVPT